MAIFNKNAANKIINQYPNIKHWYICGHSMGEPWLLPMFLKIRIKQMV